MPPVGVTPSALLCDECDRRGLIVLSQGLSSGDFSVVLFSLPLAGSGIGNGGSRAGRAVVSQEASGQDPLDAVGSSHWLCSTAGQDSAALSRCAALKAREQAGWLFTTVSVGPLRVPELDGVTVPGRALLPSHGFSAQPRLRSVGTTMNILEGSWKPWL